MDPAFGEQLWRLERRVAADPDNVPLRCELLQWQSRAVREDPEGAVERARLANLEVLYALRPREPDLLAVLAPRIDPHFLPAEPSDPEARAALRLADDRFAEDRPEEAAGNLREALLAAPDSPAVHLRLGELRCGEGRWDEALEHLRFALAQAPGSAAVWATCGRALRGLRRWPEAFDHGVEALVRNPLCAAAEEGLAQLAVRLGYRWQRVPLCPLVWPLIPTGRTAILMSRPGTPHGARRAWYAWSGAAIAACAELTEAELPVAGLPRDLPRLEAIHRALLSSWHRWRWWRWRRRRRRPERELDWLTHVAEDGLLEAYLLFAYLHPDLTVAWQAHRAARPRDMERLIRSHLVEHEL